MFDRSGVVDVDVSGLVLWHPDDRTPGYDIHVSASAPGHILPVNRPTCGLMMRATSWYACLARMFPAAEAEPLVDLFRRQGRALDPTGISVWGSASALNRHTVRISLFGIAVATGSNDDFAAAVLRTTNGESHTAVNVEAAVSLSETGARLQVFSRLAWVRSRPHDL